MNDSDEDHSNFRLYHKEAIYENMYIKTDEIEADVRALAHLAKIAGKPNLIKELKPFKSKQLEKYIIKNRKKDNVK